MGWEGRIRSLVVRFTEDPGWLPSVSRDKTDAIHAELPDVDADPQRHSLTGRLPEARGRARVTTRAERSSRAQSVQPGRESQRDLELAPTLVDRAMNDLLRLLDAIADRVLVGCRAGERHG